MSDRNIWTTLLLAALILAAPAAARAQHSDAGHGHGHGHAQEQAHAHELKLNHGQKWQTDRPLRQAMTEIRTALAETSQASQGGDLSAKGYTNLADRVDGQIDYMIENCDLPPDADAQLHIIIERMMEGVEQMRGTEGRKEGVTEVAGALEDYGTHFDHEGWRPLQH